MLLDPITIHQRRSICIPEDPEEPQGDDKENHDVVDPSLLVSKDESQFKLRQAERTTRRSRNGVRRQDRRQDSGSTRTKGMRRIHRSGRRRVGVVFESSQEEGKVNAKGVVRTNSGRQKNVALSERLSNSSVTSDPSEIASNQVDVARRRGIQRTRRSLERATERGLNQKARQIQATFRGYLGRAKFREQFLLKKLEEIEQRKQEKLATIEALKQQEMSSLKAQTWHQPLTKEEETWRNKSDVVTQLLARVQTVREKNSSLKQQIAELKNENKRLAIANSCTLAQASQEELRINRMERCSLRLHDAGRAYKGAFLTGRQLLRDFDKKTGFIDRTVPNRMGQIMEMMHVAKAEDDLLLLA